LTVTGSAATFGGMIVVIPEPGTAVLVLGGLCLMLLVAHRRR
jgi:hypothetical protein